MYSTMFSIVKPIENDKAFRQKIQQNVFAKICSYKRKTGETDELFMKEYQTYSRHLERATYNHTLSVASTKKIVKKWDNPNFVNLYLTQIYRLLFTLEHTDILDKITNKSIRSRDVPSMSAQEICPEKWNSLIQMKLERDKNLFNEDDQATTDQFPCWKCKKNKCVFYELQTSSGDESTTIFITCLSCGNRWKTR